MSKMKATICPNPKCPDPDRGDNLTNQDIYHEVNRFIREYECHKCDTPWSEVYELAQVVWNKPLTGADLKLGDRVRFKDPCERFPHYIIGIGSTGTVVFNDGETASIFMDQHVEGITDTEWNNCVDFYCFDDFGDEWNNLPLERIDNE